MTEEWWDSGLRTASRESRRAQHGAPLDPGSARYPDSFPRYKKVRWHGNIMNLSSLETQQKHSPRGPAASDAILGW